MARILITGCGGPAATNFVDAINQNKHNHTFVGVDSNEYMLALSPLENKHWVPRVSEYRGDGYSQRIEQIIFEEGIDFIHPQPDVEVAFLSREFFEKPIGEKMFLPDPWVVRVCQDKLSCYSRLKEAQVRVPLSTTASDRNIEALLQLHETVWLRSRTGAGSKASLPIRDVEQSQGWLNYWNGKGVRTAEFMASEFLPGKEYAYQSLWFNGELVSAQARERVEYLAANLMPSGQSSSPAVARTISRDDVYETGEAAVRAIIEEPHGIFCVDMKSTREDVPCVTEINAGRFFTTSNFFAHAGLNMPEMYLELGLTGELQDRPGRTDQLPDDLYWLRQVDMGYKLVDGAKFNES